MSKQKLPNFVTFHNILAIIWNDIYLVLFRQVFFLFLLKIFPFLVVMFTFILYHFSVSLFVLIIFETSITVFEGLEKTRNPNWRMRRNYDVITKSHDVIIFYYGPSRKQFWIYVLTSCS